MDRLTSSGRDNGYNKLSVGRWSSFEPSSTIEAAERASDLRVGIANFFRATQATFQSPPILGSAEACKG
jgi:hypothetical protein